MNNDSPILFRWLGVAGLEFRYNGLTLLIDPYLTRIPILRALFCRIKPDERKFFRVDYICRCDARFLR